MKLYILGLIALTALIIIGTAMIFIFKSANNREECEILKLENDINISTNSKANAHRIAHDIQALNCDVLDNRRYRMYENMIKLYNAKFGVK